VLITKWTDERLLLQSGRREIEAEEGGGPWPVGKEGSSSLSRAPNSKSILSMRPRRGEEGRRHGGGSDILQCLRGWLPGALQHRE
jgi:hypothetical protein